MIRHVATALALLTAGYSSLAWPKEPISVTLCSLSSAPEKYDGVLVRVHARVMSDGLERTVLVDVDPQCRYGGASFEVGSGVSDQNFEKIGNTIFSERRPGTRNKFIRGDFIGVFRLTMDIPHLRELEVQSVTNLKITLYGDERR
jgi:hypothetical protein